VRKGKVGGKKSLHNGLSLTNFGGGKEKKNLVPHRVSGGKRGKGRRKIRRFLMYPWPIKERLKKMDSGGKRRSGSPPRKICFILEGGENWITAKSYL